MKSIATRIAVSITAASIALIALAACGDQSASPEQSASAASNANTANYVIEASGCVGQPSCPAPTKDKPSYDITGGYITGDSGVLNFRLNTIDTKHEENVNATLSDITVGTDASGQPALSMKLTATRDGETSTSATGPLSGPAAQPWVISGPMLDPQYPNRTQMIYGLKLDRQ